jgi:uncharacterized membrane protein HdeD (DUF308 family)
MNGHLNYNNDPNVSAAILVESKKLDLESGWLGKFFGAPTHSPINIAGLLILSLIVSGIVITFLPYPTALSANEYWTKILPLITLALGYLFGKKS